MGHSNWLTALQNINEAEGIRILRHRFADWGDLSQFFISSKPEISPVQLIRGVKGRLQSLIRDQFPKALQRNYALRSIGSTRRAVVAQYIEKQLEHHGWSLHKWCARLAKLQIKTNVDLAQPRRSAHGLYWYNLHLVLVNDMRYRIATAQLERVHCALWTISKEQHHLLSRASILPDHIHLLLGCNLNQSPLTVALAYLNGITAGLRGQRIFQSSFHVSTCGEYDLGVIPRPEDRGILAPPA